MKRFIVYFCMGIILAGTARADLFVDRLGVVSFMEIDSGLMKTRSTLDVNLVFRGGYRLEAWLSSRALLEDMENGSQWPAPPLDLRLESAGLTLFDAFGKGVHFSWFAGSADRFCDDSLFVKDFGIHPFNSEFAALAQTRAQDDTFTFLYRPRGTGAMLSARSSVRRSLVSLYAYQDAWSGSGYYGMDLRIAAASDWIQFDGFAGASFSPVSAAGAYRAGAAAHLDLHAFELFLMGGVPRWESSSPFDTSLFLALIEPRIHLGALNLSASFLYRPAWYDGSKSKLSTAGQPDLGARISLGSLAVGKAEGGVDGRWKASSMHSLASPTGLVVSPFISFLTRGARWDFRMDIDILPAPAMFWERLKPSIGFLTAF